ncbi:DUF397 domain-containing protein [Streptomyces sp. NPDC058534]|uniref:DUF397 domain-containing protein n=1 Tax=Streptomyces sp. NPDC058534 TaxID=3346541 RepID=UPI00365558A8
MNDLPTTITATDLEGVDWVKSSYSNNGGNCVEVADLTGAVALRDSKQSDGPALILPADSFGSFITGVREGGFDA